MGRGLGLSRKLSAAAALEPLYSQDGRYGINPSPAGSNHTQSLLPMSGILGHFTRSCIRRSCMELGLRVSP